MRGEPDIWTLLFVQLPEPLRWVLAILTCGLFALAGWVWRRHQMQMDRVEAQVHRRIDALDTRIERRFEGMERRLDEANMHLIDIANNTRRQ